MKNLWPVLGIIVFSILLLVACGNDVKTASSDGGTEKQVEEFTVPVVNIVAYGIGNSHQPYASAIVIHNEEIAAVRVDGVKSPSFSKEEIDEKKLCLHGEGDVTLRAKEIVYCSEETDGRG